MSESLAPEQIERMETDLSHLPERKRQELAQIVDIIRGSVEVEMIILYGSYARGDWKEEKDLDPERWSGHPSDYDILIVVAEQAVAEDVLLWERVSGALDRARFSASVRPISADVNEVNSEIAEGRYFYRDVRSEGRLLYDSGRYRLAEPEELGAKERLSLAREYFDKWCFRAKQFYSVYEFLCPQGDVNGAAFNLNQAAESAYKTILLVHTLYCPHEHYLKILAFEASEFGPVFREIFPRQPEAAAQRFNLLDAAYIGARYHIRFKVTQEDLDYLAPRVKRLLEVAESICREELARLERASPGRPAE
ncbi:hypothetical protein CAI21_10140 [Alkalilimnicola ehrlichii]|uniref:HEPN domain-containing protein n=1 Tax=Alkalilimnicola ehrlichii TaxID=351052 RepID=A0A3E0WGP2_9GAMM|nr:HEPN domain-containing protein [Alkalilimnicola ehrlichii]RFA29410.1 hypothetical protein CAI21_10140 [Alkalilimnicola ehrlichii]RFA31928.1 hypothetical protein CAL65_20985 [Alkalilimnicola ehrlichii]